jgi:putative hydrolase of the HAD superfamily
MSNITAILFDMDGTLYESPVLLEQQRVVAMEVLRDFFQWDQNKAQEVFDLTEQYLIKELGCKPTISGVVVMAGVPLMTYLYECGRRYDGSVYIKKDKALISLLKRLRKQYKLLVVTNNNRTQTDLILTKLGIEEFFHHIYSLYETRIIKPDPKLYENIVEECGLIREECLVVGDRYDIDLAPAEKLGMQSMLVQSIDDLYNIEDHIQSLQDTE